MNAAGDVVIDRGIDGITPDCDLVDRAPGIRRVEHRDGIARGTLAAFRNAIRDQRALGDRRGAGRCPVLAQGENEIPALRAL